MLTDPDKYNGSNRRRPPSVIRDVHWAPYEPIIMSATWGNDVDPPSIIRHQWHGLGKKGLIKIEDWIEKNRSEQS